jgi:hypothetical protein
MTLETDESRLQCLHNIIEKYFEKHSPVELNLPGTLIDYVKELKGVVSSYREGVCIERTLLERLRIHCITDTQDIFKRFQQSAAYKTIEREEITIKTQEELLHQTGMNV